MPDQRPSQCIDAQNGGSNVVGCHDLFLLPSGQVIEALAVRLESLISPRMPISLSRVGLRHALAVRATATVWNLVRLKDWRCASGGWMTTRAISAKVNGSATWWADHTRKEIYTAGNSAISGAQRPASYWGTFDTIAPHQSMVVKLAEWWRLEYPDVPWNKRWVPGIRKALLDISRDLGIAVATLALGVPKEVFEVHSRISVLPEIVLTGGEIPVIEPSPVQHIWKHLEHYQRIMVQSPNLLFAFHHAAYGSGPGPWARTAQDLQIRLMNHGISKFGWRQLVRHGNRLLLPWFRLIPHQPNSFGMITEALAVQQILKDGRVIPMWFVVVLIRAHHSEWGEQRMQRGWVRISPRILKMAAVIALQRTGARSRDAMRQDIQRIVRWGCQNGISALDEFATAGWTNFSLKVRELTAQFAATQRANLTQFDFVRLMSDADFQNEGALLENCLADNDFRGAGIRRDERHYSLRLKGTSIRVGVASFRWHEINKVWQMKMVEGPSHAPAPKELISAVTEFATHLPRSNKPR